jgi:tape measure domain-containing protein
MNLGNIVANLRLNANNFVNGLRTAMNAVNQFGSSSQNSINGTNNSLNSLTSHLKSVERIIGGIFISQMFYRASNEIQNASTAMFGFMNNLEKAQISMRYFLGDAEKAKAFVMNMEDFAAETSFNTEQSMVLSRRLMAAQFDPSKVRSIMEILNDASAASGGTAEQMDRIVLALSQLKTNGKIAGQELRQLAEAGIPIYKILADELGIAEKEILNIGEMKIPGDMGVAAVLNGLEKRYKGAAKEIANTMSGMWETIQDDAKMLGAGIFDYPYRALENFVRSVRDKFEELRNVSFELGAGGVFERLFTPETQMFIRLILGSIRTIIQSFKQLAAALAPVISLVGGWFAQAFGMALPILAGFSRAIADGVSILMRISPELRYFLASVVTLLVVNTVAKALLIFWRVTALGMICTAVAGAVQKLFASLQLLMILMVENPLTALFIALAGVLAYFALQTNFVQNSLANLGKTLGSFAGFDPGKILVPKINTATQHIDGFNKSVTAGIKNLDKVGKGLDKDTKKAKKLKEATKFLESFDEVYQIPEKTKDAAADVKAPNVDTNLGAPSTGGIGGTGIDIGKQSPNIGSLLEGNKHPKGGGGGGGWWADKWDDFKTGVKVFWKGTKEIFKDIGDWWDKLKTKVIRWGAKVAVEFVNWLIDVKDDIKEWTVERLVDFVQWFKDVIDKFEKWRKDARDTLSKWDRETREAIKKAAVAIWSGFKEKFKDAYSWFRDNVINKLISAFNDKKTDLANKGSEAWKAVKDKFTGAYEWFRDEVIAKLIQAFKDDIADFGTKAAEAWTTIKGKFTGAYDWFKNDVVGKFTTAISDKKTEVANKASEIWTAIKGKFSDAYTWFKEYVVYRLRNAFNDKKTEVANKASEAWSSIKAKFSDAYTWFRDNVVFKFRNVFSDKKKDIANKAGEAWSAIKAKFNDAYTWFRDGPAYKIKKALGGIKDAISGSVTGGFKAVYNTVAGYINSLITAINKMVDKLNDLPMIGGIPHVGKIPYLAKGGIVDSPTLAMVGERGKEAVMPLENNTGWISQLAGKIAGQIGGGGQSGQGNTQQPILYVGTLIADDKGLKELNRRMRVINIKEGNRGVGI